jgi:hypothetical protein
MKNEEYEGSADSKSLRKAKENFKKFKGTSGN